MFKNIKKQKIFDILQIGHSTDKKGRIFDVLITFTILLNLFVTIFGTFNEALPHKELLYNIEFITVIIFIIEYILRIWTAEYLFPTKTKFNAKIKYIFSFLGIVDFLTIFIFFIPSFFSAGMAALKMLRIMKLFHLFKTNKYNDSLNIIVEVLRDKKEQILTSVFLIGIMMITSSMIMYSIENPVQPDKFENAFSGIWWSVSTLLTVGYGDIYPITTIGKAMAIVISFLGVGLVAIPTGIISAGFVEHYEKMKLKEEYMDEQTIRFVVLNITEKHPFKDNLIKELNLPMGLIIAVVIRDDEALLPKGDLKIEVGDKIILGAEAFKEDLGIALKEIIIKAEHPWVNKKIKNIDISRQTLIIYIKRKNKVVIPNGDTVIHKNDTLVVYTKENISDLINSIEINL